MIEADPQSNRDRVVALYDALNRGDFETALEGVAPDYEFISISAGIESGAFRGREGLQVYFETLKETWSEWHWDVKELRDLDPATVLAVVEFHGVGRISGVPVTAELTVIYESVDGVPTRGTAYPSLDEALAAFERSRAA